MNYISYEGPLLEMFEPPRDGCDVVIDMAAYYGIDAPFSIAYLLKNEALLHVKGFYPEPFSQPNVATTPGDGMIKSYYEILRSLEVCGRSDMNKIVFRGSKYFLPNDRSILRSEAVDHLAELANHYDKDYPLYIIALGPLTNIASALMLNPDMKNRCVVVWQGGDSYDCPHINEPNIRFDTAAARYVLSSGVPMILFPYSGVVDHFSISKQEIINHLVGRNGVLDELCERVLTFNLGCAYPYWTMELKGIPPIAWLVDHKRQFMKWGMRYAVLPGHGDSYEPNPSDQLLGYVYHIQKDKLMNDLIEKLTR
ncbi:MAG: nucleoside hydrolase [Clostridia bacterium]|nr:nucleoside hydrolase [Clostridia bacterium]